MKAVNKILVTGPPGCGKSTLVIRIAGGLEVEAAGFTTAEIRAPDGTREGFRITTLSGRGGILAHRSGAGGPRVGRYRVNLEDLDRFGAAEIERAIEDPSIGLIVVDEIARMELCSRRFRRAIERALDAATPILATIQQRRDPFLDAVRARGDVQLVRLDRGGFDRTERLVRRRLDEILRGAPPG